MDSYYRPDDEEDYNHYNQDHVLKRVSIEPEEEMKRLERDEIGIKSGIKGSEIKQYVDRAIQKLIYYRNPRVTLKAIGVACSKVLSIADILRRKIKGLQQIHNNYSRKYIAKYQSDDGKITKSKIFRLPCLDIVLTLDRIDSNTPGYIPALHVEELDRNYLDPENIEVDYTSRGGFRGRSMRSSRGWNRGGFRGNPNRGFRSRGYRGGFRGRGYRGGFRGRDYRGGFVEEFRGRGGFRGAPRGRSTDEYSNRGNLRENMRGNSRGYMRGIGNRGEYGNFNNSNDFYGKNNYNYNDYQRNEDEEEYAGLSYKVRGRGGYTQKRRGGDYY